MSSVSRSGTRTRPPSMLELMAYADGELPAARIAEVERFLAENDDARAWVDDLRQTSEAIAAAPPLKLDFASAVLAQVAKEDRAATRKIAVRSAALPTMLVVGFAAAAAAALFVAPGPTAPLSGAKIESSLSAAPMLLASADTTDEPDVDTDVDGVDFGSHTGAIFYVPSAGVHDVTTVVWVQDDEDGP